MGISHVAFDIDGTLLDTEKAVLYSLSETLRRARGQVIPPEQLTFALGITGNDALLKLQVGSVDQVSELWSTIIKKYRGTVRIFPGIKEILDELKEKGYQLGIVTSETKIEYITDFISFGLADYFSIAVCADDTQRHKPYGDPLAAYLRKSGANMNEVLYVGDSEYDIDCAKAAGVKCALALWGGKTPDNINPDYQLNEPKEIMSVLKKSE